ncbi:MAG: CbiQ family ECF transporter T component [Burkholderiales bacterium]|nr:CbiQ family ECF transporter T component [Burkholderiales bacterium]
MTIHPTALLLAWVAFAVAIPWFGVIVLWAVSALLALGVWAGGVNTCWRLVRRTRILLIALLVLYAFSTPGSPLIAAWEVPTQEGLQAGALQAWRLLLMITALAILLARLKREQLLAGIYGLLAPLKPLGLPLERIAVRLWLTLQYAESGLPANSIRERWEAALTLPNAPSSNITLEFPAFTLLDLLFVIGFGVLLVSALLW